ncbi:MAG: hypothetical protein M3N26_03385 [Pseudomonadota bacterium]|nr:hypothetical protein [Pseudomonadota bacterium]
MLTGFLASAVEFVEALTVILAVGSTRGWRAAILGALGAVAVMLALVAALGSTLAGIPIGFIRAAVGVATLMFGMRWLQKAILRAGGVIPLRDEDAAFARQTARMRSQGPLAGWDRTAFSATFQVTLLEGVEVVFIVIAIGAGGPGLLLPASFGALAALLLVVALGVVIHRPLARVPENSMKFVVGVLLSAFGCFWFGEGIGIEWPGEDVSILALVTAFLIVALISVRLCRDARPLVTAASRRA